MKKALLALVCAVIAAAAVRFGPAVISYTLIPPEHGYYRNYRSAAEDAGRWEEFWLYWKCSGTVVVVVSPRQNIQWEQWELVPKAGRQYFLYDARNEFDGRATFSRTEMILHRPDGQEQRYPRELDLWEIWQDGKKAKTSDDHVSHQLAAERAAHEQLIAARMKERGILVSPAAAAQRRPPVLSSRGADESSGMIPLFAVREYGYHNNTGTVFAVYANGMVICRSLPENPESPYHRCDVADADKFVRELLGPGFSSQRRKIKLSDGTDAMGSTLWTPGKVVSMYGDWRRPDGPWHPQEEWTESERKFSEQMKQRWETELAGIRPALEKIEALRKAPGPAWLPAKIEVGFTEYEHSADAPSEWPAEWPGLYDESSIKSGSYFRVFVPVKHFPKLKAFLDTRPTRGAVMIDLNQMAPSMRFPFPSEDAWMRHLNEGD